MILWTLHGSICDVLFNMMNTRMVAWVVHWKVISCILQRGNYLRCYWRKGWLCSVFVLADLPAVHGFVPTHLQRIAVRLSWTLVYPNSVWFALHLHSSPATYVKAHLSFFSNKLCSSHQFHLRSDPPKETYLQWRWIRNNGRLVTSIRYNSILGLERFE